MNLYIHDLQHVFMYDGFPPGYLVSRHGALSCLRVCLSGSVASGSILVVDGKVVAEAENSVITERDPTGHVRHVELHRYGPPSPVI